MNSAFRRRVAWAAFVCPVAALLWLPGVAGAASGAPRPRTPIEHFVFVMQGERTFDNYFGTYPGADGIPPGTCQARLLGRPQSGCVKPYPLASTVPPALAPGGALVNAQLNNGRLDGFVSAFTRQGRDGSAAMGYYDRRDVSFYWALADQYTLFDRFFAAAPYGIRVNRSYWVAAAPVPVNGGKAAGGGAVRDQLTIFDRLNQAGVSWKFYVQDYRPPRDYAQVATSDATGLAARVPLFSYSRFADDPALRSHIVDLEEYYKDLNEGTLPAVSYVVSSNVNERSARSMVGGQRFVNELVSQLMMSPYWARSALMLAYDGSGGWYDHVPPPMIGGVRAGLRVPALLVSAYAKAGHVDHTTMDYAGALRFIEDNWNVPALNERDAKAASIAGAFDFTKPARAPIVVQSRPTSGGDSLSLSTALEPAPRNARLIIYLLYGAALVGGVALLLLAVVRARNSEPDWSATAELDVDEREGQVAR